MLTYLDTKLLFILHVTYFIEIVTITGLNFTQIESGPMQTQQNFCQPFSFIQSFISCLDFKLYVKRIPASYM